jgi:hypothetical protein
MKRGTVTSAWIGALVLVGMSIGILSCETNVVSLTGPDDCTQYLCTAGSEICCSGARHGTWDAARGNCTCPSLPDAGPDVRDDAEVWDGGSVCDLVACIAECRAAGHRTGDCTAGACYCADEPPPPWDVGPDHYDVGRCPSEMGGFCNVVLQCGCAAGERCVLNAEEFEECAPIGSDPIDTRCSETTDNCVAQNQCFGTSATDMRCMQFCYEDTDCPGSRTCDYSITGVTGYRLCGMLPGTCLPLGGEGCPFGDACVIDPPTDETSCVAAGTAGPGETCDSIAGDCRVGTACYTNDGSTYACFEYCDLAGVTHPCPAGLVCGSFGHDTIGVCAAE